MTLPREPVDSNPADGTGRSQNLNSASQTVRHASAGMALLWSALTSAQEMEPRTYSAVPIGTNFVVFDYARSTGGFSFDPSLPITDVQAKINTYALGFSHSFALAGHTASVAMSVPYANANVTGDVEGAAQSAYRSGLGDTEFRFAVNLLGNPALTPEEFARSHLTTILGTSLTVVAPTGQYVPSHLINVGSNRWSFKPELGVSQPIGNWFVEGAAGVWLFTNNNDFNGGQRRSEDPIPVFQWHGGYNWRPGLWIAADVTYFMGGRTSVNGVQDEDVQRSVRYGVTLSVPLGAQWSAKLAWSRGLITRVGGDFQTLSVALQYHWFTH
jgi:hypothetical protein